MSTTTSAQPAQLTRNERLDRLPFNKAHRKLLVASGIGWAFDAMDVGLVSFVVAAIAADPHFNLTPTEKSWVLSIGFVGMAIGAAVGGFIADRVGRKTVFTATLIIFGIANGAMALSWSLGMLLGARLIIGLGLGAELPVASTLVSEFSPTKQRGRMTVLLESFWAVGWIVAAMIGYFVIPNTGDWGWRWALAIGALPLLYAIVTRVHIPESVRFLEAKGREDEAEKAVRYFEEAGGVAPVTSPKGKPLPKIKTRELFGSKYLARTIAIWATWFFVNFSYYGAFTWMPSLLADQFGSLTKSFGYTLAISIAQLPGYFLAAWLVEVWGRRKTLSIFLAVSAVAAFAFSQAGSVALVLVFGMLLSASNLGAWGVLYAVTPEIYPTRLRGAAAGAAAAVGRIAAIIAPLLMPWFLTLSGGNKAVAFCGHAGLELISQVVQLGDRPQIDRLLGAIRVQLDAYAQGKVDRVYLAYSRFINAMKQEPVIEQILPLTDDKLAPLGEKPRAYSWDYIYEPDAQTVLDELLKRYVEALIYSAVAENMASEQSARMVAMKAASDNAKKLIDELQLVYNKTRQAGITKEITEIVGGAAAVS